MKRPLVLVFAVAALAFCAAEIYLRQQTSTADDSAIFAVKLPAGFEVYSTSAELILPLHEKKRPIRPGDWLDRFPEGGQTFAAYVQLRNQKPSRVDFSTIYVQPLGEFDETQQKIVEQTADFMSIYFGIEVKTLDPRPLGDIPETARRMRDNTEQILSTWILNDVLKPQRPLDAIAVIGLVTCDLWPGNLNWVFGSASLSDRVGVWSLHRNGDPHVGVAEFRLCLKRTLKTAVHETGHMLGIPHCAAYECCMNGSRSREESDLHSIEFCPECQPKIWWTCGTNAHDRSQKLAEFAALHGMKEEATFWTRQTALLAK